MVPAIDLGAEPPETGVMQLPPRSQKEPLLTSKLLVRAAVWYGLIESLACYEWFRQFSALYRTNMPKPARISETKIKVA